MERVICTECGSIGYTASPEQVPYCERRERHKVTGFVDSTDKGKPVPEARRLLDGAFGKTRYLGFLF